MLHPPAASTHRINQQLVYHRQRAFIYSCHVSKSVILQLL
jgi:hypothetical protein